VVARPSQTSPDAIAALKCGNQTQRDTVRRNHAAWHAEGWGRCRFAGPQTHLRLCLGNAANSPDSEVESESWPRTPFARAGVLVAAIGSAPGLPRRLPASCHALRVIYYTDDLAAVRENMLDGFFVGWPRRPSAGQHLAVLRGSYRSVVAIDDAEDRVAGFVNMISDGVLTAFIPWLEVLPAYQGQGIGSELMCRILDGTDRFYSVDLVCDAELIPYYERFGMRGLTSAMLRHAAALEDPSFGA
jgi:GNAT superfamily N-acetyltransferase